MAGKDGPKAYYKYDPSMVACILFLVLFFISSALHTYQVVRTKTWFFIAFTLGCWFQVIGYVGRAIGSSEYPNNTLTPFIINYVFPLVAPAMYAASVYMLLGRIMLITDGEKYSIVRRTWMTKLFVAGDVASFLLFVFGGTIITTGTDKGDSKQVTLGKNVILIGLWVQIIVFGLYIITGAIFNYRMKKNPTTKVLTSTRPGGIPYQKHMNVLFFVSFLILLRSIFRLIEYLQGYDGYLLSKEVFGYVFDALPMFVAQVVFHLWHPSEINALLSENGGKVVRKWIMIDEVKSESHIALNTGEERNGFAARYDNV